jgi:hypothetical protein
VQHGEDQVDVIVGAAVQRDEARAVTRRLHQRNRATLAGPRTIAVDGDADHLMLRRVDGIGDRGSRRD